MVLYILFFQQKDDDNQLVKYKNIGSYLQLYIPSDHKERKRNL